MGYKYGQAFFDSQARLSVTFLIPGLTRKWFDGHRYWNRLKEHDLVHSSTFFTVLAPEVALYTRPQELLGCNERIAAKKRTFF